MLTEDSNWRMIHIMLSIFVKYLRPQKVYYFYISFILIIVIHEHILMAHIVLQSLLIKQWFSVSAPDIPISKINHYGPFKWLFLYITLSLNNMHTSAFHFFLGLFIAIHFEIRKIRNCFLFSIPLHNHSTTSSHHSYLSKFSLVLYSPLHYYYYANTINRSTDIWLVVFLKTVFFLSYYI